jgi:hypothetical protein
MISTGVERETTLVDQGVEETPSHDRALRRNVIGFPQAASRSRGETHQIPTIQINVKGTMASPR